MEEKILGHNKAVQWLKGIHDNKRWSHAYLFCGPAMIGKTLVARYASELITGKPFNENNPDVLSIGQDEETDSLSVEEVRRVRDFLSLKPYSSDRQVVIVENADQMSDEAANAFLKTLEEPNSAIIFLITHSRSSVPETILSRCQVISFSPLNSSEVEQYLKQFKLKKESQDFLVRASAGRPGWAKKAIEDKVVERLKKYTEMIRESFASNVAERIVVAKEIYESGEYARSVEAFMLLHTNDLDPSILTQCINTYSFLTDSRYNHRLALENLLI